MSIYVFFIILPYNFKVFINIYECTNYIITDLTAGEKARV